MKPRLWQWLVLFFSRPIRFSDVSALARRLKPRAKADRLAAAESAAPVDAAPKRSARVPERKAPAADTRPSIVSSMFHPELEIGVSEQPLDSLPAELRDELVRPSTGRLQGSLSGQGGGPTAGSRDP